MVICLVFILDSTERKFQRAIELYRQANNEIDKTILKVMDALATYYMKTEKFQVRC